MKIKPILGIALSILLSGCVAAIVVGAAAGLVYDKRSIFTIEADARIFHLVHTAVVTSPELKNTRILVTSFNRIVLLVGQVPTASLRVAAEKIAQSTPGVYRVYNEIEVRAPIPIAKRTMDSWITSSTRSSMLTKKGLESGSIRIVTENGIVYLMGIVSKEQSNYAVDVARRIKGVTKVVKLFQYIH